MQAPPRAGSRAYRLGLGPEPVPLPPREADRYCVFGSCLNVFGAGSAPANPWIPLNAAESNSRSPHLLFLPVSVQLTTPLPLLPRLRDALPSTLSPPTTVEVPPS